MITYVNTSIFESPADMLVNTVNTVGAMGKGIAKEFKKLFKEMYLEYQKECEEDRFHVGDLMLYRTSNKIILNFPTKKHWRSPSKIEYIELGLQRFSMSYKEWGISSVAFPQLGCGNGELDWESQVREVMEKYLSSLSIDVFVHLYDGNYQPEHKVSNETKQWLRNEPRSLPVFEVWEDLFDSTYPMDDPFGDTSISIKMSRDALMLKWIWENLRSFGYVGYASIEDKFSCDGEELARKLEHLPYVECVRFANSTDGFNSSSRLSTKELLDRPESDGLRLVHERLPEREAKTILNERGQISLL